MRLLGLTLANLEGAEGADEEESGAVEQQAFDF